MASLSRFYKPGVDFKYTPQVLEMPVEDMYKLAELKEAKMAKGEAQMGDVLGLLDKARAASEIGIGGRKFPVKDRQRRDQILLGFDQRAGDIAYKYQEDLSKHGAYRDIIDLKRDVMQSIGSGELYELGVNLENISKFETAVEQAKIPGPQQGYRTLAAMKEARKYSRAPGVSKYTIPYPSEEIKVEPLLQSWFNQLTASGSTKAGIIEVPATKTTPAQSFYGTSGGASVTRDKVRDMMVATFGVSPNVITNIQDPKNKKKSIWGINLDEIDPAKMSMTGIGSVISGNAEAATLTYLFDKEAEETDPKRKEHYGQLADQISSGDLSPNMDIDGRNIYKDTVKDWLRTYMRFGEAIPYSRMQESISGAFGGTKKETTDKEFNYPMADVPEDTQADITNKNLFSFLPGSEATDANAWATLDENAKALRAKARTGSLWDARTNNLLADVYDATQSAYGVSDDDRKKLDTYKEFATLYDGFDKNIHRYSRWILGDKYDKDGDRITGELKDIFKSSWDKYADKKTGATDGEGYQSYSSEIISKAEALLKREGLDNNYARGKILGFAVDAYDNAREKVGPVIYEQLSKSNDNYNDFLETTNKQSINSFLLPSGVESKGQNFLDFANTNIAILPAMKNLVTDGNRQALLLRWSESAKEWESIDVKSLPNANVYGATSRPFGKYGIGLRADEEVVDANGNVISHRNYIIFPVENMMAEIRDKIRESAMSIHQGQFTGATAFPEGSPEYKQRLTNAVKWLDVARMNTKENHDFVVALEVWDASKTDKSLNVPIYSTKDDHITVADTARIWKSSEGLSKRYYIQWPQVTSKDFPDGYWKEFSNFDEFLSYLVNPSWHMPYTNR